MEEGHSALAQLVNTFPLITSRHIDAASKYAFRSNDHLRKIIPAAELP